jgi:hypothetical protein
MGVKLFVSGEIAFAADVNEFFMEQSIAKFANIAARTSAFGNGIPLSVVGGDGKPLLKEGQFCYLEDNSLASNGSGTPEVQFYNGTTWVGAENFAVSDGEITDVKVNAAAAIQLSKLATGTPGQIIVANASGVPTYVTLGGEATINSSGQLTIGSTAITLGTETVGAYVATINGTTNRVTTSVSAGTGGETATVTLSLPQDIHTGASPQFAALNATGAITGASASVSGNIIYNMTTSSIAYGASVSAASSGSFLETSSSSVTGPIFVNGSGWTPGAQVTIMQMSSASLSSASISFPGQTLLGTPLPSASPSVAVLRTQYSSVTLINKAENVWYVIGDLKA